VLTKENIKGEGMANITHLHVGREVRKTIKRVKGTMPEDLLPETHIKKIAKIKKLGEKKVIKRLK